MKRILTLVGILVFWFLFLPQEATALSITGQRQSATSVPLYEKLEISFNIPDTVATTLQFPYDTENIPGLKTGTGISVDGLFLAPGQTNWGNALVHPAFWFQPTIRDESVSGGGTVWVYPKGDPYWLIRFAPKQTGNWRYKIRARDSSGTTESGEGSFSVTSAPAGNHGFIGISSRDSRYFEFSDGKPFIGSGHDSSCYSRPDVANFTRIWMDSAVIVSTGTHDWEPWRSLDDRRTNQEIYIEPSGFSHDLSARLGGGEHIFELSWQSPNITGGFDVASYKVRLRAKLVGASSDNLQVKLLDNAENFGSGRKLAPQTSWQVNQLDNGWVLLESGFTNQERLSFVWNSALAVGLVGSGTAYLDEIYIGEDLGGGRIGPNVVFKGKINYHQYFDQIASAHWDYKIESNKQAGIFLRLVITDKDDKIFDRIETDSGQFRPEIPSGDFGNFFAGKTSGGQTCKVRRLMHYYWRYLTARWGYSTTLHSWELLNEGPPDYSPQEGGHAEMLNDLSCFIKGVDAHRHLAGSSNWGGFPEGMWNNSNYSCIDHADLHGYNNSSGSYHFGGPGEEELDDPQLARDMALYHTVYSKWAYERGVNKPIIRGEAGIYRDGASDNTEETPDLAQDERGVWLHNYVWSGVDPWGMYEVYWFVDNIRRQPGPDGNTSNGLYEIYTSFLQFMDNIPLSNGQYQDAQPQVSSSTARAWGQKDSKNGSATHAHLWIQNKNHTWKRVINNQGWGRLDGTVALTGFVANRNFPIEWWDFDGNGVLNRRTGTISSDGSGRIVLNLDNLTSVVADTGVKIGEYAGFPSPPPPTPTSTYKTGDVNHDGKVNFDDSRLIFLNFGRNPSQVNSYFDPLDDTKVNLYDFGWVVRDWGSH